MRRTKEWWAALEPEERSALVGLERAEAIDVTYGDLPLGYSECPWCGVIKRGWGLCPQCTNRLHGLIAKANRAMGEDND